MVLILVPRDAPPRRLLLFWLSYCCCFLLLPYCCLIVAALCLPLDARLVAFLASPPYRLRLIYRLRRQHAWRF
jgi:hypothetical protein